MSDSKEPEKKTDEKVKTESEDFPVYSENEVRKIKENFYREIERKNKELDDLKKQNTLLLKTALKNAEDRQKIKEVKENLKKD